MAFVADIYIASWAYLRAFVATESCFSPETCRRLQSVGLVMIETVDETHSGGVAYPIVGYDSFTIQKSPKLPAGICHYNNKHGRLIINSLMILLSWELILRSPIKKLKLLKPSNPILPQHLNNTMILFLKLYNFTCKGLFLYNAFFHWYSIT